MARITQFLFGILAYVVFFGTFLYAIGFVGNVVVPKSIDVGGEMSSALWIDLLLLGLFAVQHSVMARPAFKRRLTTIVPVASERSTYVLLSSLALILLFWQWRPMTASVWSLSGTVIGTVLSALFWVGWGTVLVSTFLIDHFELFGLRQAVAALRGDAPVSPPFRAIALYRYVRHPIMLGFVIAFWAAPDMTAGHLLFAVATTGYILLAIQLEERDLLALHGDAYRDYRTRTSMLLPGRVRASLGEQASRRTD